jgi:ABC-2 type transport system permease protein
LSITQQQLRGEARAYVAVAAATFRQFSTYRLAALAGLAANCTFGVIMAITFRAAMNERGATGVRSAILDGLTPATIVSYSFAAQAIAMVVSAFGDYALAARVRSGDIATDLGRPVDFSFFRLAHDLGRSAFHLLARGLSVMAVGWLVFRFPLPTWLAAIKFVPLVVLAAAIASRLWTIVGLASFWMRDGTGAVQLMVVLVAFGTGGHLPLQFYPTALKHLLRLLPFASMMQLPCGVLVGVESFVKVGALQLVWFVVLELLLRVELRRARNRLELNGG